MPVIEVSFTTIDPPAQSMVLPVTPRTIGTVESAVWASAQPLQGSFEVLDYQGTRSRVLRIPPMDIFADTPEQAVEIKTNIDKLRSFLYTSESMTQLGGTNRPPRVLLQWPNFFFETVVLDSVDVEHLFMFEDAESSAFGRPRAWRLKVQVRQFNTGRVTAENVRFGVDGFGTEINAATL